MALKKQQTLNNDLRGINQLASEGIIGVTDLVQSMHQRIATLGGVLNPQNTERTSGLTGFIYRRIQQTTNLVTQGVDLAIKSFSPWLPALKDNPTRQQWLAVLNGVIGDHLHATNNPLALPMTCQHQFHTKCIDQWLKQHRASCPLCKKDVREDWEDEEEEVWDPVKGSWTKPSDAD